LAPGLIVTTDTTFSSNRFAWTHQVHKLDRKSNGKKSPCISCSTQLLKRDHPIGLARMGVISSPKQRSRSKWGPPTLDWQSIPNRRFRKRFRMEAEPFEGTIADFYVSRKK
jgi:hypothetical protein